jgi:hypothetical protein
MEGAGGMDNAKWRRGNLWESSLLPLGSPWEPLAYCRYLLSKKYWLIWIDIFLCNFRFPTSSDLQTHTHHQCSPQISTSLALLAGQTSVLLGGEGWNSHEVSPAHSQSLSTSRLVPSWIEQITESLLFVSSYINWTGGFASLVGLEPPYAQKSQTNCHSESSLYNECILIKIYIKEITNSNKNFTSIGIRTHTLLVRV